MTSSVFRRVRRLAPWKLALTAGFLTQLLLILFVMAIGLQQLDVITNNLNTVVNVHMRKQDYTKAMVIAARERTIIMFILAKTNDPFERDRLVMQFHEKASEYARARLALLEMPLSAKERELIAQQRVLARAAQPVQEQVINLITSDLAQDASDLVLKRVIPAQNSIMAVISQLDEETQRVAKAATRQAHEAHDVARTWMYVLSGSALLIGFIVAAVVLRYATRVGRERERLATQDTLTGLPNRMLLQDRLDQALMRGARRGCMVGVMFIDLDRFKRVNDTLGHASGDQLIAEVGHRLRDAARAEDTVARLGGDEFVVVVNDAGNVGHILHVAEKMRAAMALPFLVAGRELFCSSSIGISVFPHDGTDSSSLLKNADTAMYHAKSTGRDCFQLYDAKMNAMAEERLQLETDLHYALERNEFTFHYQPQINLDSGRVQGVEALIRWNHPTRGTLAPAAFLEMLEETGEIVNVGRKLLLDACRQGASWHAEGFHALDIAVNLSSKEFWHASLLDNVQHALVTSGLPPQSLHLELTEGIFMEDIEGAVDRIQSLKSLGIAVAVDDFGTGYSSLAHLKRFPINVLKIDRYFIKDLPYAPVNQTLIASILALCDGLYLDAIAEGVEDMRQLRALRELGCRIVQGFLFSEPVPAERILDLLQRDWRQ